MKEYFRPILRSDSAKPKKAFYLAGQNLWFDQIEVLRRKKKPRIISVTNASELVLSTLVKRRVSPVFNNYERPLVMGILNLTPDSFSDGGTYFRPQTAFMAIKEMIMQGVDIIDVGAESTRPGATFISEKEELTRIQPILQTLEGRYEDVVFSVDTQKARVMQQALSAGFKMVNDVSALTFDKRSAEVVALNDILVCLMHANFDHSLDDKSTAYEDSLLDVYDFLEERVNFAVFSGIPRDNIVIDPGIGFGKTLEDNLTIIRNVSLFHSLGCPLLVGASRKGFIGKISKEKEALRRLPGSIAVALELFSQGVQIVRVHDIGETKQALSLWNAVKSF